MSTPQPPNYGPPVSPATHKRPRDWIVLGLVLAVLGVAAYSGYLSYQLQATNSLLQHRIDLVNHYSDSCTGTTSSDGLVFTETCTDSYGDICTFTETFASTTNPSLVSSTTTCRPA